MNVSRSYARHALLALTIGCIVALAVLKVHGTSSGLLTDAIGGVLAVAFIALALIDFRTSVAVTIFEIVLGGAGGHWIDYGSLSGRIFLITVVTLRAAWLTILDWRRGVHPVLGRYGAHALAIAFLLPAIWIPLGLLHGNSRHDAIADGNGFLFFAFVLVVLTLLRRGQGPWLRRTFFAACATSGAAYFLLIVATKAGALGLGTVREWLTVRLAMGGIIGHMPNGDYRLFTAGSLFTVIGLALTAQRLLVRPRDLRLWLLGGMFGVDLVATYTRGLWLAALVGVVLVVALEVRSVRQLGLAVGIPVAAGGLVLAVAALAGFSLYSYVSARASTVVATSHTKYNKHLIDPGFEASSGAWGTSGGSSLRVSRSRSVARVGRHSLELSSSTADQDAYVFQDVAVKPNTEYSVSAWVNARALRRPAAGGRGLFVWDVQDGLVYTVPLTKGTHGWRRLSFTFQTRADAQDIQIRLYAPQGHVFWDGVRFTARGPVRAVSATAPVEVLPPTGFSSPKGVLDPGFEASSRAWGTSGGGSLRVSRSRSVARVGRHSLELSSSTADQNAYVFQDVAVKPNTEYSVSAWVNARALRRAGAGGRGLFVWDAQDGLVYTVPLTDRTHGWRRLSFTFQTRADAQDIQIRLYAPQGHVFWDGVRFTARGPVEVSSTAGTAAAEAMALASNGGSGGDAAGAASNAYRIAEAKALWHYIRRRPIYGYGFGSVATNFSATDYSFELSYLDLLFKAGILGLLLYLSFPLRLVADAFRLRRRRVHVAVPDPRGASPGIVAGVVAGILVAGATNPYLFAAFGLVSILLMVAWLEDPQAGVGSESNRSS